MSFLCIQAVAAVISACWGIGVPAASGVTVTCSPAERKIAPAPDEPTSVASGASAEEPEESGDNRDFEKGGCREEEALRGCCCAVAFPPVSVDPEVVLV